MLSPHLLRWSRFHPLLTHCASPTDLLMLDQPCIPRVSPPGPWCVVFLCVRTRVASVLLKVFASLCIKIQYWPTGFFLMELSPVLTLQRYWPDKMLWQVCSLLLLCSERLGMCVILCHWLVTRPLFMWGHPALDGSWWVSWLWPATSITNKPVTDLLWLSMRSSLHTDKLYF